MYSERVAAVRTKLGLRAQDRTPHGRRDLARMTGDLQLPAFAEGDANARSAPAARPPAVDRRWPAPLRPGSLVSGESSAATNTGTAASFGVSFSKRNVRARPDSTGIHLPRRKSRSLPSPPADGEEEKWTPLTPSSPANPQIRPVHLALHRAGSFNPPIPNSSSTSGGDIHVP